MSDLDWKAKHQAREDERNTNSWNENTYFEGDVVMWKSNKRPVPNDVMANFFKLGFANYTQVYATKIAKDAYDEEVIGQYLVNQANRTPEQIAEEEYELHAAFGPGETVVNVFTGKRTTT